MALIKLGSLVTRISGKIGGQTLGTSASGSYIRNTGSPRKSQTVKQQSKMALMAHTAQKWRTLTPAERTMFNNATSEYSYINRVGETKYYSGFHIFAQLNQNQITSGSENVYAPLPKFSFLSPSFYDMYTSSTKIYLEYNNAESRVSYRLFASRPSSVGISTGYKNQFYIGAYTFPSIHDGIDITDDLINVFGVFPIGSKIFWRIDAVHVDSGQVFKKIASKSYTR